MTRKRCKTYKGVSFDKKKNLWSARITFHGVRYSLGRHKSKEKALQIYKTALELGGFKVKAWCNTPVEYRGQLGQFESGITSIPDEEEIIRKYSTIRDGATEDEEQFLW